jgi:hypothetical protein
MTSNSSRNIGEGIRRVPCDASFILQNHRDPVGPGIPIGFASAFAVRPSGFKKLLVKNFTRS